MRFFAGVGEERGGLRSSSGSVALQQNCCSADASGNR
jgi:hypothetical protein